MNKRDGDECVVGAIQFVIPAPLEGLFTQCGVTLKSAVNASFFLVHSFSNHGPGLDFAFTKEFTLIDIKFQGYGYRLLNGLNIIGLCAYRRDIHYCEA